MAVKSKTQLDSDIAASTFTAPQQTILGDIVDSYEDVFSQMTTAQRDALSPAPTAGQIIYNTDNDRYEYWNGSAWYGIGQDLSTPLVVKIDLSSAEILALHTTGIEIAAAPGVGYALSPTQALFRYTYGSAAYVNGSGNIVVKAVSKTTAQPLLSVSTDLLLNTADRSGYMAPFVSITNMPIAENDAIEIKSSNAFTVGDGTLTVWVTYSIIVW